MSKYMYNSEALIEREIVKNLNYERTIKYVL